MTLPRFGRTRIATGALAVLAVLLCTAADASAQRLKVILDTDIGSDIDDAWALGFAMLSPRHRAARRHHHGWRHPGACKDGVQAAARRGPRRRARRRGATHTATGPDRSPVRLGGGLHRQAAGAAVSRRLHRGDGAALPGGGHADRRRPAAECGRRLAEGSTARDGAQARGAHERIHRGPRVGACPMAEWNVVRSTADAQVVYAAGLPLTTVPLDSTTYVTLKEEERERLQKHDSPAHTGARDPLPPLAREARHRA